MTSVRTNSGDNTIIQSSEVSSSTDVVLTVRTRPLIRCRPSLLRSRLSFPIDHRPINYFAEVRPIPRPDIRVPSPANHNFKQYKGSTRNALLSVVFIFSCSVIALTYVYMSFPDLEEYEREHIKVPWDIEDVKQLGIVLDRYKDRYFFQVLSGIFITYIFLQTFAIPGSLFLSILSGFLFPFPLALVLVCVCSMTGASLCYLLSQLLGRRLVKKFFPERAKKWAVTVDKHRDNIFHYILFLRMTPFLPNWFINLTAPVIGVPLVPFALGTFIGVGPPSFLAIQAGQTLYKMSSSNDAWSWSSVFFLGIFALLSLVPVFLKKQLRQKFE